MWRTISSRASVFLRFNRQSAGKLWANCIVWLTSIRKHPIRGNMDIRIYVLYKMIALYRRYWGISVRTIVLGGFLTRLCLPTELSVSSTARRCCRDWMLSAGSHGSSLRALSAKHSGPRVRWPCVIGVSCVCYHYRCLCLCSVNVLSQN